MTFRECVCVFTLPSYLSYLTPVLECLVCFYLWFILIAIVLNVLIRPAFLGFDTLWNTPLGKCYNGTYVCLRTLVILWITIWIFLASFLGSHNLASRLRNTNSCQLCWAISWKSYSISHHFSKWKGLLVCGRVELSTAGIGAWSLHIIGRW
jgi:hypothetical protein